MIYTLFSKYFIIAYAASLPAREAKATVEVVPAKSPPANTFSFEVCPSLSINILSLLSTLSPQ